MRDCKILILGAGPTGLGAAYRLNAIGNDDWLLFEAAGGAGGLAGSVVDSCGFTWDFGGHVVFSHYDYFDRVLDEVLKDKWVEHIREAWIWMRDRFIPYPFQNNIWRLPAEELLSCLDGLLDAQLKMKDQVATVETFYDWILYNYGQGLCDVFFHPYNCKVWAYDPTKLGVGWTGERVARVDLHTVLRSLVLQQDQVGWGPNARFRFPLQGGTGSIWRGLSKMLPAERQHFGNRAVSIDLEARRVRFDDGSAVTYETMISSIPLDTLLSMIADRSDLSAQAASFVYSSTHVIGLGMEGKTPEKLSTKCWMYFPEPEIPFYRATVFSNYSSNNVARPGEQWSLMCEVSESPDKPVRLETVVAEVEEGAKRAQLVTGQDKIVSRWHHRLEHGYPTPFLGRDELLGTVEPVLRRHGIHSRGRFGAWKYEVSNQDHSFMQGVEAVDNILFNRDEVTYFTPHIVNSGKKMIEPELPSKYSKSG